MAHANRRRCAAICDVLGVVMDTNQGPETPSLLNVVALLADRPKDNLTRGQVGTVVESLRHDTVLVEFSDENGRPYAIVPCAPVDLLVLHYQPHAA